MLACGRIIFQYESDSGIGRNIPKTDGRRRIIPARKRKQEGKPTEAIRIGLRGGGCDGFSYVFEWADKPAGKHDHVLEFENGTVRVFIDKKSMLYLRGTTLNFVTGLMGHGFKFENPNVKGSCGCGESVQF